MEEFKYIIFQLGEQRYGINLLFINGIEQGYNIIPVPNAPDGIVGLINLRGTVIPVYSLRHRFGLDARIDNPNKSLLVANCFGELLAYEVDCVVGIEEVEPARINRMPSVASNDETAFMEEVLRIKDDIVIVISVDEVLSDSDKEELNRIVEEQS